MTMGRDEGENRRAGDGMTTNHDGGVCWRCGGDKIRMCYVRVVLQVEIEIVNAWFSVCY